MKGLLVLLKTHWVLVVTDQFSRRIIGFAVHVGNLDGLSLCRMFNRVISRHALPRCLSTDHDPLFRYHRWQANLRVLDIEPVKTVPYVPLSHPFVDRLIGSVRREFLDQTLFWNSLDLERKLGSFRDYYNDARVHASLADNIPMEAGGKSTNPARRHLPHHLAITLPRTHPAPHRGLIYYSRRTGGSPV